MHALFGVDGWLGLAVHGLVGALAYAAVLVFFAASPAERAEVMRFWRARGRAPAAP
jgi:hypothetical protein